MPPKSVLYFAGGHMKGIFGAGVVTALEDENIYPHIEAIYCASAGAFNAVYFLTKQSKLGSTIYHEDLVSGFIVSPFTFLHGILQRILFRPQTPLEERNLIDAFSVDHLMNAVTKSKKLNVNDIGDTEIPLYVKVFNLSDRKIEYTRMNPENCISLLRAAAQLLPYTHIPEKIRGRKYIDAANIEPIGIDTIRMRHPNSNIVVILNGQPKQSFLRDRVKRMVEGKVMTYMTDQKMYSFYRESIKTFDEDIKKFSPARDSCSYIPHRTVQQSQAP